MLPTIKIPLVQTTPMWHFQGDSPHCCLRATEVKPKLDRFLLERYPDEIKEEWKNKKHPSALAYKLHIACGNWKELEVKKYDYPLFFGNMGTGKKKTLGMFKDVQLEMFSYHSDLLKMLEQHLPQFFASTSFGTRQDKGFGCFAVEGKEEVKPESAKYQLYVELRSQDRLYDEYPELFKHINCLHKMIRSGVNDRGTYVKSFMYQYSQGAWDKPVLRRHFFLHSEEYKKVCYRHPDLATEDKKAEAKEPHFMWRDWLGMSGPQKWMTYKDCSNTITIKGLEGFRYKSPIDYHPMRCKGGFMVYITLNPPSPRLKKEITNLEFLASTSRQKEAKALPLKFTPNFNLEEYFEKIVLQKTKDKSFVDGPSKRFVLNFRRNFKKIQKS
ncbi:MAG: hypothetical protein LIO90_00895 [Bacteroidales bacterium]|nr:hypothetical protein [Bacteroidales bacterium]